MTKNIETRKKLLLYGIVIPIGFVFSLKIIGLILQIINLPPDPDLLVGAIAELATALIFFCAFRKTIKFGEKHILTPKRFLFCLFYLGVPFLCNAVMSLLGGELKSGAFAIIAGALAGLAYGVTEEIVFRGVVLNKLIKTFKNRKNTYIVATLLTAGVFGLCHFFNLASQPFLATLGQVYFAIAAGMAFCGIYLISGTLIIPIILHVIVDICHTLLKNDVTATSNSFNWVLAIFSTVLLVEGIATMIYWQKRDSRKIK